MGKASKIKVSKKEKHIGLGDQIEQGKIAKSSTRVKQKSSNADEPSSVRFT